MKKSNPYMRSRKLHAGEKMSDPDKAEKALKRRWSAIYKHFNPDESPDAHGSV